MIDAVSNAFANSVLIVAGMRPNLGGALALDPRGSGRVCGV